MSKFYVFIMAALLCAAIPLALAEPLAAQTNKDIARLSRELQRAMSIEAPLTEEDYRVFMANLDTIYALRQNPESATQVSRNISGWTPSRFAYVTTKMAVGMLSLVKPDDPRNLAVPDFARPSEQEMRIIRNHRDELVKAVEALQASEAN
jgi:hypothetical protein